MMKTMKDIYYQLPMSWRSVAASSYGYYLRFWRYGGVTEKLVQEALGRETWSPAQWEAWQQEQLRQLLDRAATQVPYYRAYWQDRRRRGDRASWEDLENWPIISKEPLRTQPEAFLADDYDKRRLFELNSSGTSGTPVTIWRDRAAMQGWYALFEARWRRWYGVDFNDRWAILGGKIVTPVSQEEPPFWVWNRGLNQLYMSTLHIKPTNVIAYLDALRQREIVYLYGYVSSLYTLARMVLEQGLDVPPLRIVIANAEPLPQHQRDVIEEAFKCPVRNTYGMSEAVAGASECEAGNMHLWPEAGLVEVLADETDTRVAAGVDGRLICTGFLNRAMPLIRYEVGDRGALSLEKTCTCGRTLPQLERLVGRLSDNIVATDGRRIFQVDQALYALHIKEAQMIQERLGEVLVKVVPAETYSQQDTDLLITRLQNLAGRLDIRVEMVDTIPRTANGKFRAVISKVDA